MIDMNGKVALVTGAAGGIGAATVAKLGALGGAVVAHDLREPGGGDLRLCGDLRDPEAARALWARRVGVARGPRRARQLRRHLSPRGGRGRLRGLDGVVAP